MTLGLLRSLTESNEGQRIRPPSSAIFGELTKHSALGRCASSLADRFGYPFQKQWEQTMSTPRSCVQHFFSGHM
jgi:hypothetical protein